jgi:hypothetical protein
LDKSILTITRKESFMTYLNPIRSLLIGIILVFILIDGIYDGFRIRNTSELTNHLNIMMLLQSFDDYKSALIGSSILKIFNIFVHNCLLDIFYAVTSCFTLGLAALPALFIGGNTFGQVLHLNHEPLNLLFVSLEALSMYIMTYTGTTIGWAVISGYQKIQFKRVGFLFILTLVLLAVGAIVETITLREVVK